MERKENDLGSYRTFRMTLAIQLKYILKEIIIIGIESNEKTLTCV